jgi:hypothetical protein
MVVVTVVVDVSPVAAMMASSRLSGKAGESKARTQKPGDDELLHALIASAGRRAPRAAMTSVDETFLTRAPP